MSTTGTCRIPGLGLGLAAVFAVVLLLPGVSTVYGQTLNGVTCADVMANGVAAQDPSERGFTNPFAGAPIPLPARSGFDYMRGWVWVKNDGANGCGADLNDLYLCLEVAGRWGDADGDGVRDAQGGLCGDGSINPGADGPIGELPLSRNEALTFFIDRDCDGFPDLQLEVAGEVGGSPSLVVTGDEYTGMQGTDLGGEGVTFEYSDKDNAVYTTCPAEVTTQVLIRIPNWNAFFAFAGPPNISPAVFTYDINGGNRLDGPPEDNVRGSVDVALPDLSITKEPNLALCEGQQGNLTITVTNTGNVKVSNIVVTDELPVGWSSCGVVSGGVTVQQVGTTLTFSGFDLEPCEVKEIVFCIEAGAECTDGENVASAEGAHLADCLDGGGRGVGPVTASSLLTCLPDPCIEIRCDVNPKQVCAGDDYTVEVWGMNCSDGPEDIVLWIDGESQLFTNVPSGHEVHFDWTFTAPVDCPAGTLTEHTTRAVATNECNPSPGVEAICVTSVTCLPDPCVSIIEVRGPEECVPPGGSFEICVVARNCSDGLEDIEIRIGGERRNFPDVAPGGTVEYCATLVMPLECEDGELTSIPVYALAVNICGDTQDMTVYEVECCPVEECLELVIIDEETIDNDIKTIEAAARHCSGGIESDYMVNDDRPTEHGNPPLRWNELCPGQIVTLPSGQLEDEGFFRLPENTPWSHEDFVAGVVPQDRLDKIRDVQPLRNPELKAMEGKSFVAVVYDSDISMNYDPINANLQGARYGLFFFTVLDVIPPGTLDESGSSSSLWDVVLRVDPVPDDFCIGTPSMEPQAIQADRRTTSGRTDLNTNTDPGGFEGGDQGMQVGQLALYSPTPNPFNSSTRIAYAVNGGTSERVEIGIYNVAGRQIRKLVSGMESPGYHEATWDGRSDAGVQVTPGVYFLRAFVGSERISGTRILYMP